MTNYLQGIMYTVHDCATMTSVMRRQKNPLEVAPGMFRNYVLLYRVVTDIITERLAKELKRYDPTVTPRQYWIMMAAEAQPFNQATIADVLDINHNQMVREVDKLERRGLIRRIRNPRNRRETLLQVTPKAQRLIAKGNARLQESRARIFHPAPVRDIDHNIELAGAIINDQYKRSRKR